MITVVVIVVLTVTVALAGLGLYGFLFDVNLTALDDPDTYELDEEDFT